MSRNNQHPYQECNIKKKYLRKLITNVIFNIMFPLFPPTTGRSDCCPPYRSSPWYQEGQGHRIDI